MTTAKPTAQSHGDVAGDRWRPEWLLVIQNTVWEVLEDRIPSVAAGVTFFALLAIFPAIASIVSLYGMFADRESIRDVIETVAPFIPGGATMVLNTELHRLIAQHQDKLNFAFVSGLLIAMWSASGGVRALIEGLNVAYETRETRSLLKLFLDALLFTAIGIAFATGAIALAVLLPVVLHHLRVGQDLETGLTVLILPIGYVCSALVLGAIYRFGPSRQTQRPQWLSWGAVAGSLLWTFVTLLFSWYVQNFGSYDRVYGNLGALVGFLTWIWLLLLIMLAGAELNCEIERRSLAPAE